MPGAIDAEWERLEQLLGTRAPASRSQLLPAANDSLIRYTQDRIEIEFHEQLAYLYDRHDGTRGVDQSGKSVSASYFLPGDFRLLPLEQVLTTYTSLTEILRDHDESMEGYWWHPLWVPFAANVSTDVLFVDHRPGATYGAVGWLWHEDSAKLQWSCLAEFFHRISHSIETGEDLQYFSPELNHGLLTWGIRVP